MNKFCFINNCIGILLSVSCLVANAMVHRYYWCTIFAVLALLNAASAIAVYRISHKKDKVVI